MGLRLGGAAVSNTDGRGFDTFRACFRAGHANSGHQHLDNCTDIVIGAAARDSEMGRSRHGAHLPVEQASYRHRGFDSLPTHQPTRVTPHG